MRITIGGILLVGGIAAVAVVMGPSSNPADLLKQAVDGVTSLVKSVSGPAVIPIPSSVSSSNASATPVVSAPSVSTATTPSPPVAAVAVVENVAAPESAPAQAQAVPEKHTRHRHRRARRSKTAVAKSAKTVAPSENAAKPASSSDPLIGRYVSVKLKSGREVKGILQAKTPQGISLEIPGMGPFQYPSSNIDGIKSSE